MNKRLIALIVVIIIILIGITTLLLLNNGKSEIKSTDNNSDQSQKSNTNKENNENDNNEEVSNCKIAVIYFSATGTTENVAKTIQRATKGDMIEIVPKEEYTSADLNYNNDCRVNKEQNSVNARPEIKNTINVESYDTIYLGYPIWWGDVPKIILTFLDTYNLEGKKVIPFCTSGGSGIEKSMNTLKSYNNKVNWISGKRLSSFVTQSEIENWVNTIEN